MTRTNDDGKVALEEAFQALKRPVDAPGGVFGSIVFKDESGTWRVPVDRVFFRVVAAIERGRKRLRQEMQPKVRVPRRGAELRKWRATWRAVRRMVEEGRPYSVICAWLGRMHPDLACSEDTLADVVRAGEGGLLD